MQPFRVQGQSRQLIRCFLLDQLQVLDGPALYFILHPAYEGVGGRKVPAAGALYIIILWHRGRDGFCLAGKVSAGFGKLPRRLLNWIFARAKRVNGDVLQQLTSP